MTTAGFRDGHTQRSDALASLRRTRSAVWSSFDTGDPFSEILNKDRPPGSDRTHFVNG